VYFSAFWLSFTGAVKRQRRMGCCEGKLPNPDDFLAAQSPRPVGPFLECAWVETLVSWPGLSTQPGKPSATHGFPQIKLIKFNQHLEW